MSTPVLRDQCPAFVVAPPAGDLQVPRREPFATKPKPTDKGARDVVAWLDVRLHAMKAQLPEDPPQSQRKALGHVSTTGMRDKCVVV